MTSFTNLKITIVGVKSLKVGVRRLNLHQEMEQFKADLLTSVKELKSGEVTLSTQFDVSYAVSELNHVGVSENSAD